jgi:hypothetical protein
VARFILDSGEGVHWRHTGLREMPQDYSYSEGFLKIRLNTTKDGYSSFCGSH